MVSPLSPPTTDALFALRDRLDSVDRDLHRLLRERFEIVGEIGAAKGPDEPIIRPAREAAVIENRLSLHSGAMPREVLVHIWRVLIGAACASQRPFTVHVAGTLDAARFLYGPATIATAPDAHSAVAALAAAPGDIALVPADAGRWWGSRGTAHVIGRYALSDGGAVVAVAGPGVSPGTGPLALVVREDAAIEVSAAEIAADDDVLGRYHPFPLTIPVAQ